MSVTGEPSGPPMKVGVALLDLMRGLECAVGALARSSAGSMGSSVSVNLVEAGVTSLINVLGGFLARVEPRRHGNAHPNIAPYQAFAARDGTSSWQSERRAVRAAARRAGLTDADGASRRTRSGRGARGAGRVAGGYPVLEPAVPGGQLSAADVPAGRSTACPRRWRRLATDGSGSSTACGWHRVRCASRFSSRRCGGLRRASVSTPTRFSTRSGRVWSGRRDRTRDLRLGRPALLRTELLRSLEPRDARTSRPMAALAHDIALRDLVHPSASRPAHHPHHACVSSLHRAVHDDAPCASRRSSGRLTECVVAPEIECSCDASVRYIESHERNRPCRPRPPHAAAATAWPAAEEIGSIARSIPRLTGSAWYPAT